MNSSYEKSIDVKKTINKSSSENENRECNKL